jgi:hypothetical protein
MWFYIIDLATATAKKRLMLIDLATEIVKERLLSHRTRLNHMGFKHIATGKCFK